MVRSTPGAANMLCSLERYLATCLSVQQSWLCYTAKGGAIELWRCVRIS